MNRTMNLHQVSAAVAGRAAALLEAGLPCHAHALDYMLASLARRDAPGDWLVLEQLAAECDRVMKHPSTEAPS